MLCAAVYLGLVWLLPRSSAGFLVLGMALTARGGAAEAQADWWWVLLWAGPPGCFPGGRVAFRAGFVRVSQIQPGVAFGAVTGSFCPMSYGLITGLKSAVTLALRVPAAGLHGQPLARLSLHD